MEDYNKPVYQQKDAPHMKPATYYLGGVFYDTKEEYDIELDALKMNVKAMGYHGWP
jgi:hypothetical protein